MRRTSSVPRSTNSQDEASEQQPQPRRKYSDYGSPMLTALASGRNSTTTLSAIPNLRASSAMLYGAPQRTEQPRDRKNKQRYSITEEARRISARATQLVVRVPAEQLKRMAQTKGVHSIRTETQHFVGIATLHGPLRVYRSRGKYRLFWISAMIFCWVMMLYQMFSLIMIYLNKPIVSQVSFLQPEEGMEFPLVTICSFNFINKHTLADFKKRENVSQELLNFILQSTVDISVLSTFVDAPSLTRSQDEYEDFLERSPDFNVNDFFRSSSLICNETLKICQIGAEEFDCCRYASVVMTDMGNCYQIDLRNHPSSTTKQIGVNNGLQIYANFHSDEHSNLSIPDFLNNKEMGFRYFVHSRNDYPFITSEGIGVPLGHRTFSAISPNRFLLLTESDGGKCIAEWPEAVTSRNLSVFENGADSLGDYSSTKCMAVCLATFFHELCGCTPLLYNFNGTFPTCTVFQNYFDCLGTALNVSADSSADEIMRRVNPNCQKSCKMECQRWDYQIFNSYSQPFSRSATAYLMKHEKLRQNKLDKDYVGIDIYYRDIAYTEYKQVQKTSISEIWSDIGGNMGLFLGMSLLSVIEVVIYLFKISWLFLSRKRRQHMVDKKRKTELRQKTLEMTIAQRMAESGAIPGVPSPTAAAEANAGMRGRLHQFTRSIRHKTGQIWPSEPMAEEAPDHRTFEEYYLDNYVEERINGMGKAMDPKPNDFVELQLDLGATPRLRPSRSPPSARPSAALPTVHEALNRPALMSMILSRTPPESEDDEEADEDEGSGEAGSGRTTLTSVASISVSPPSVDGDHVADTDRPDPEMSGDEDENRLRVPEE